MDAGRRVYRALADEANRALLVFGAASVLGVLSVASFVLDGGDTASRGQFAALVAAMALIFYLLVRSSTFR